MCSEKPDEAGATHEKHIRKSRGSLHIMTVIYICAACFFVLAIVFVAALLRQASIQTQHRQQERQRQISFSTAASPQEQVLPAELFDLTTTSTELSGLSTSATRPIRIISPDTLSGKPPQFIVLAFDGSQSLDMWKQTRRFASEMTASGTPVHFTYFINPVYLITPQNRALYRPPHKPVGASAIGFAYSAEDVANRVEQINLALGEGSEIGSHAVGHWNGSTWSEADWKSELDQFSSLVSNVETNNRLVDEPPERRIISLPAWGIVGFRAPLLGRNDNLYKVLTEEGYQYDTSSVAKPDVWPIKLTGGLWEFPLARINYASSTSKILSMDYNFYFKQSGAKDVAIRGSSAWQRMYNDTLTSYRNYFKGNFAGTRAPVFIGHHFSRWNDGVYWEVMKTFAREECGKPEVRCVTYRELADYLDRHVSFTETRSKQ